MKRFCEEVIDAWACLTGFMVMVAIYGVPLWLAIAILTWVVK